MPHLGEAAHLVQLEQGGGEEGGQLVPEPAEEAQLGAGRRQRLLGPPPGHEGGDGVVRGQDLRPAQSQLVLQKVPSEANPKVRNHGEGPY